MRSAIAMLCVFAAACAPPPPTPPPAAPEVVAYDVIIETGPHALGTYSIEAKFDPTAADVVRVQGGDPPYNGSPHTVPATYSAGTIEMQDFHILPGGPAGHVRVARISLRSKCGTMPAVQLVVNRITDAEGKPIAGHVRLVPVAPE